MLQIYFFSIKDKHYMFGIKKRTFVVSFFCAICIALVGSSTNACFEG